MSRAPQMLLANHNFTSQHKRSEDSEPVLNGHVQSLRHRGHDHDHHHHHPPRHHHHHYLQNPTSLFFILSSTFPSGPKSQIGHTSTLP